MCVRPAVGLTGSLESWGVTHINDTAGTNNSKSNLFKGKLNLKRQLSMSILTWKLQSVLHLQQLLVAQCQVKHLSALYFTFNSRDAPGSQFTQVQIVMLVLVPASVWVGVWGYRRTSTCSPVYCDQILSWDTAPTVNVSSRCSNGVALKRNQK